MNIFILIFFLNNLPIIFVDQVSKVFITLRV